MTTECLHFTNDSLPNRPVTIIYIQRTYHPIYNRARWGGTLSDNNIIYCNIFWDTTSNKMCDCDRFSLVSKKFHEKLLLYSLLCSSPLQLPATCSHVLIITLYLPEDTETAEDSLFPPQIKTRLQRTQVDASIWYSLGLHPEIIRSHQTSSQHWFLPELGHILSPQCT